ncbi:Uu.00g134080.m01.CDS01 [Anthostomella pinea]|uniref:Uu.00g134080.m01.CDS01 n=1 Tax=Anthostomella pinea TaxID=933095 RepID=A0AAI8VPL3_9PEZI|nr:Uu.00g134080.m01.CDS01 [Anthostomella pinea]
MATPREQASAPAIKVAMGFTESHWRALIALLDAVVPSIVEGEASTIGQGHIAVPSHQLRELHRMALCGARERFSIDEFRHYMASRPSDDPNFVANVKRAIGRLPPGSIYQLRLMLSFMLTRLGSIISTGYWATFSEQPLAIRASILRSWQQSWFPLWPALARIFITVGKVCWSQTNQLYLELNGYKAYSDDTVPGPSVDFNFIQFQESIEPAVLETDIVIVGSGCGGAVCAKVLAEAGLRVLVVEQGYYFPPKDLPMALDRVDNVFEGGGGLASTDGSTLVTAGRSWGGGGTVNWSACLQTPSYIRKQWAKGGLTFFEDAEYQDSLDRVCNGMGVSEAAVQGNHGNMILLDGSRKLGWRAATIPQNAGGSIHECGSSCGLGCRTGKKQSPAAYWLPAAARAGARFVEGFEASQVLFEASNSSKATGVIGQWTSRDEDGKTDTSMARTRQTVEIRAKTVIMAGGALNTPLILLGSGVTNPNIGKNLYLHPVVNVVATWEPEVKPWEGEILSSVVTEFEDLDGAGHGVKIESLAMQPYAAMLLCPWKSGVDFKAAALQYRHMTCHISLPRDRDAGSVSPEPVDHSPVIQYTPSKFDRGHIATGLVGIAKLCYVLGATRLTPAVSDVPSFECIRPVDDRDLNDQDFVEWVRLLERTSLDPARTTFFSAHQMGTSRMGTRAETSVVDENGKVWEYDNLYVADASVFPTASGVNPMVTVMAIADRVARGIAANYELM